MSNNDIKEFLLVDSGDRAFTDLITFKKPINFYKVLETINKAKEDKKNEYTNEDIYDAISSLGVEFDIRFLYNINEIEY